jgi:hypothetical protein
MFKSQSKLLKSTGGRIFNVAEYSILSVTGTSCTIQIALKSASNVTIYWGDGSMSVYAVGTSLTNINKVYSKAGVYKVYVYSQSSITCISSPQIYSFNAGYYKLLELDTILINSKGSIISQAVPSYGIAYKVINLNNSSFSLDLSRVDLSRMEEFIIQPTVENVIGIPDIRKSSKLTKFILNNWRWSGTQDLDLLQLVAKNSSLITLDVAYQGYYATTPTQDISSIIIPDTLTSFRLYTNTRYVGDLTNVINKLNGNLSLFVAMIGTNQIASCNSLVGDYYSKSNSFYASLYGNASNMSFKFTMYDFRVAFVGNQSTGDISANIQNLRIVPTSGVAHIYLRSSNGSSTSLDVSKLLSLDLNYSLTLIFSGNTLYGDISELGNKTKLVNFAISEIDTSNTRVTGWSAVIDNMYAKRSQFASTAKVFNAPTIMKNVLTGTYQAPAGFVKGSSDGTPTTHREKIYVLTNNYNWTFTNI